MFFTNSLSKINEYWFCYGAVLFCTILVDTRRVDPKNIYSLILFSMLRCTTEIFYQDFVEMIDAMLCNDLSFFMQTQIKSFNIHKCAHVIWMVFIYNNQSPVLLPSIRIPDLKRELIVLLHVNCYHMLVKYWQVAG